MNDRSPMEVIFFAALEKATLAERIAYLDGACANDGALRRRIEAMLAAHSQVGRFLERPVVEAEGVAARGGVEDAAADLSFLAPSSEAGSRGRLDHYEVLEVIGRGGMGVVLRARDTKLERVVAIKVLAAPLAVSGTARRRFIREARATAAVRDDHIVAIHAVCDEGPTPYLVMEYIDGCNLESLIRRGGPLEVKEALCIGIQIAKGLAAAHKQGLIHRDIKPANILLENGVQRVKLTDFGLARAADDASLTHSGLIAGTPTYMSPEQANGEPVDHKSDLFSLGSVMYELCTGRPAFRAPSTVAVIRRVCDDTPRPIREVNPDVPEALCQVIERLHAKKPADRPASANEVADLLTGLLARLQGQGPEAISPRTLPLPALPRRASPRWRWAAAALVLLCVGLGLGEATGLTDVRGTVIRLFSSEGTLVVEVDDPNVSVTVDGADLVITGAGAKEIRLKPGQYKVEASKDGQVVRRELVTVDRNGRQVVRISKESEPAVSAEVWEKYVAKLPPEKQVEAVAERLKQLNPGFDGTVSSTCRGPVVSALWFNTDAVTDISPLRALPHLESLDCSGTVEYQGKLADLSPLCGLRLRSLVCGDTLVADLSPLQGMPLEKLHVYRNPPLQDLTPLTGMPLTDLAIAHTRVADLSPLKQMKLRFLYAEQTRVSDLSPLKGMPLEKLSVAYTRVSDLSPLQGMPLHDLWVMSVPVADLSPLNGMPLRHVRLDFQRERDTEVLRSLKTLQTINNTPAADFWTEVEGK